MSKEKEAYFKGLPPTERITALTENADAKYNKSVVRYFTEEELSEKKTTLSEVSINLNDIEIEKKEATQEINARLKIEKSKRTLLLKDLKNKYFESDETVFDIADQENGMMLTFDYNGILVGSRRLTPKEKQTKLITLQKQG